MLILMMMMAANRKQQQQQHQRVHIDQVDKSPNSSSETVIARSGSPSSPPTPPPPEVEPAADEQVAPTTSEVAVADVDVDQDDEKPTETSKQRSSRLRSFLQLTAHLNPFYHSQQQQPSAHHRSRKGSVESQSTGNGSKQRNPFLLIELAQRYFGLASAASRQSAEFHQAAPDSKQSKSAPVTPVKWQPLTVDQPARANGFRPEEKLENPESTSIANETPPTTKAGATPRPSVRFVDSADSKRRARLGRWGHSKQAATSGNGQQQQQFTDRAVQTSTEPAESEVETGEVESPVEPPAQLEDLIGRLFKIPEKGADTNTTETSPGEVPMDSERFRKYGYSLIDYISNYLDTIDQRRVTPLNIVPGYLKNLIAADAPELGESFARIMHDFEKHIMCGITHWQHPHFHAYFPAGNAYPSILADMLSDALGCVGFSWAASPAYTELEIIMLDWMGKMIGLPDEFLCLSGAESKGGGVIQGSASECVLVNLLAARHWAMEKLRRKYPDTADGLLLGKLIGYCSKEAHSCVEKAAMIGFIRMRALDTDEHQSLRGDTLEKAMEADLANGLEPFLVCATLGTTSCVSFDNLEELGQVCERHDVWLHVDAAYAGSALICPEFKHLIKGVELASSFNMNPNKWMLINFDCSLMWVRDRFKLTRAFVVDPLYLQHSFSDQAIDYRHWGIPLSRRFRALKLWFVIRNYGVEGLRAYIRNHVRLAKLFAQLISEDPRFTITNQVTLGLVCFRLVGSNALNQRLLSMINASGQLHMVPASVNGRYVIRFCVCDQNAKEADIQFAYSCISDFASELFESIRAGKERIRAISQQNTIDVSSVSLHTQQSASADRLNKALQTIEQQQQQTGAQQQVVTGPPQQPQAPVSGRQHMLRRASRQSATLFATCELDEPPEARERQPSPASHSLGGAKSPLIKQLSVAPNWEEGVAGTSEQVGASGADEDLAEEVVLDSLDDYELEEEDDEEEEEDADFLLSRSPPEQQPTASGTTDTQTSGGRSPAAARRWQASRASRNQTLAGDAHEAEAEDEVFTLERRNRMSLRYKREFFVRVVSDPRVYRASISGDINAHSSCASLGGQQRPAGAVSGTAGSASAAKQPEGSSENEK